MATEYVPNYGDLDDFQYERLVRTKSRSYQIACWQGYLGTHEFFLGRSLRGFAILSISYISFMALIWNILLGVPCLILVISLYLRNIRKIAESDPNGALYGEICGPVFYAFHVVGNFSILWDVNFWKGKTPTDPLDQS